MAGDIDNNILDNNAGAGEGEPGQGAAEGTQTSEELAQLRQELDTLKSENRDYKERMQELTRDLLNPAVLRQRQQPVAQQPVVVPPAPAQAEPEIDWDNATPNQLREYVEKSVERKISERLSKTEEVAAQTARQMELQEAVRKYPDFWLYGQAMINVAHDREARGIYLSAEDCYHLAKALHPVRSNAASTRTTNPEPIAKPSRRAPASAERPGVSPQSTTQTKTTLKEAMEQAWESTMGRSE